MSDTLTKEDELAEKPSDQYRLYDKLAADRKANPKPIKAKVNPDADPRNNPDSDFINPGNYASSMPADVKERIKEILGRSKR